MTELQSYGDKEELESLALQNDKLEESKAKEAASRRTPNDLLPKDNIAGPNADGPSFHLKIPEGGPHCLLDYFFDINKCKWAPWKSLGAGAALPALSS
jgi:hypothetical protein